MIWRLARGGSVHRRDHRDLGPGAATARSTSQATLYSMRLRGQSRFKIRQDTIDATGTITIVAYDVADLGNLTATGDKTSRSTPAATSASARSDAGNRHCPDHVRFWSRCLQQQQRVDQLSSTLPNRHTADCTSHDDRRDAPVSAGGNISVGTINAGTGTVAITSSVRSHLQQHHGSTTLSITAGGPPLQSSAQSAAQAATRPRPRASRTNSTRQKRPQRRRPPPRWQPRTRPRPLPSRLP